jgi:hypothetical protein
MTRTQEQVQRQISAEIATVMKHINTGDYATKLKIATSVVHDLLNTSGNSLDKMQNIREKNHLLRIGQMLVGQQSRPDEWPATTNTTNAPSLSREKIPPASTYESYSACVNDLTTNYRASQPVAENYCKSVNADPGQSGPNQPINAKGASVSQPAWLRTFIHTTNGGLTTKEDVQPESNIRNASVQEKDYFELLNSPLHRNRELLMRKESIKKQRILSAKQDSNELPYYMANRYLDQ